MKLEISFYIQHLLICARTACLLVFLIINIIVVVEVVSMYYVPIVRHAEQRLELRHRVVSKRNV